MKKDLWISIGISVVLVLLGILVIGILMDGYHFYDWEILTSGLCIWFVLCYVVLKIMKREYWQLHREMAMTSFLVLGFLVWLTLFSSSYLEFRMRMQIQIKHGEKLELRGYSSGLGITDAVYYRASEPDYYFHARTALLSDDEVDEGYKAALAASMIDDMIEEFIRDVIPGEYKMSSECMSMSFHEELDFSNVYSMMARTKTFRMYLILDDSMIVQKEQIIEDVCDILKPYFWNTKTTIYFAFTPDVSTCERYSWKFNNSDNVLVYLTGH